MSACWHSLSVRHSSLPVANGQPFIQVYPQNDPTHILNNGDAYYPSSYPVVLVCKYTKFQSVGEIKVNADPVWTRLYNGSVTSSRLNDGGGQYGTISVNIEAPGCYICYYPCCQDEPSYSVEISVGVSAGEFIQHTCGRVMSEVYSQELLLQCQPLMKHHQPQHTSKVSVTVKFLLNSFTLSLSPCS